MSVRQLLFLHFPLLNPFAIRPEYFNSFFCPDPFQRHTPPVSRLQIRNIKHLCPDSHPVSFYFIAGKSIPAYQSNLTLLDGYLYRSILSLHRVIGRLRLSLKPGGTMTPLLPFSFTVFPHLGPVVIQAEINGSCNIRIAPVAL